MGHNVMMGILLDVWGPGEHKAGVCGSRACRIYTFLRKTNRHEHNVVASLFGRSVDENLMRCTHWLYLRLTGHAQ